MNLKKASLAFFAFLLIAVQAQTTRAVLYSDLTGQGQGTSSTYPYASGGLVNDHGTIYFIRGTVKVPFTNWAAFVGLGYSSKNVVAGDLTNYTPSQTYVIKTANAEHPWGSWLSYKGTVYYSTQGGLIGVPSAEVFTSNGGQWPFVVKANKYDIAALQSVPNLPVLADADPRVSSVPSYQFSSLPPGPASVTSATGTTVSQASTTVGSTQVSSGLPGALNMPTLSPSSTPSQMVFSNTSNQPIAAFNFTASGSPVTIQELDFVVQDSSGELPVTWVSVNGQTSQFVNASSSLVGLNITVPLSGVTIPVSASFANVTQNFLTDNQTFTLNLVGVKYLSGTTTSYVYPNVASNSMDLVAGGPANVVLSPSAAPLTDNNVLIAKVIITTGPGDGIILNQLPFLLSTTGGANVAATSGNLTIADDSGVPVQISPIIVGIATSSQQSFNVILNSNNFIAANSSKTYDLYLPVQGAFGAAGSSSLVTLLGPSSALIYSDPTQGTYGNNIPAGANGVNYILNYPTSSVSVHN
jgi:hypothetical protein